MNICIVTPWLNCPELAAAYWRALTVCQDGDHACIIDNNSDVPVYTEDVVIVCPENLGFSKASNLGLRWAAEQEIDATLFLNNDIVMTNTTWLEQIRTALKPGRLVGAEMNTGPHSRVDGRAHPYLDGWCLAGMTEDLMALGGWNEDFEEPSYYGDNELCFRAKQAGMRLMQVPVGLKHLSNHTSRSIDVRGISARNYDRFAGIVRESLRVAA